MTKQSEPKVVAPAPATNFKEEEKVAPAILTLTSNGMRKEPPAPSLPKRFYGLRDAANYSTFAIWRNSDAAAKFL